MTDSTRATAATPFYDSIANAVGGRGNAIRLIWAGREIVGEAKALEALRAFGCTEDEIEGLRREGTAAEDFEDDDDFDSPFDGWSW